MKRLTVLSTVLLGLSSPLLYAQTNNDEPLLGQGSKEVAISGIIEIPEFEEIDFDLDASYGYFVSDGWEVGLRVLGADAGGIERFDFSAFTEYNFNIRNNMVPYLGASVGLASVDFDDEFDVDSTLRPNDGSSTVFGIQAGIKWFVRPYMAFTTSIGFDVSSEDIYQADDALADNLTRFRLGLRYYF